MSVAVRGGDQSPVPQGVYWSRERMAHFWEQLSPKLQTQLKIPTRVLRLSSDHTQVTVHVGSSKRPSNTKVLLFNDILAIVQGHSIQQFPLQMVWVSRGTFHQSTSILLKCPELELTFTYKDVTGKQLWLLCLAETIKDSLHLFSSHTGAVDGLLVELEKRHHLTFVYSPQHPDWKGGTYMGSWCNALPHGMGQFSHSSSGMQYNGEFAEGKYHGDGVLIRCHWQKGSTSDQPSPASFADIRQYTGQWRGGVMSGRGIAKYTNGDKYEGYWLNGKRHGFGRLEQSLKGNSRYCGDWVNDQWHGYGIYDDKIKHQRYMGQFQHNCCHGTGIIITSTGTYCEGTFFNDKLVDSQDSLLIDPNGRCFVGRVSGHFQLSGKGELTLSDSTKLVGTFAGSWLDGKFQMTHASIDFYSAATRVESPAQRISYINQQLGSITPALKSKWCSLYEECRRKLGLSDQQKGSTLVDSTNNKNLLSVWNYWHLVKAKAATPPTCSRHNHHLGIDTPLRRTQSIPNRLDVGLSLTVDQHQRLHCSYPVDVNSRDTNRSIRDHVDNSTSAMTTKESTSAGIHTNTDTLMHQYLERAFADAKHHPLGILMAQLESVYQDCYTGMGSTKFLLPQAISDAKNMIKQLHNIVRLFFPRFEMDNLELSLYGFKRDQKSSDPDDYVSISTGYDLLQPLVFTRIFPVLFTLYILQHEKDNQLYCRGLFGLNQHEPVDLARQLECPRGFVNHLAENTDSDIIKALTHCTRKLSQTSTMFTADRILTHLYDTFQDIHSKVLRPLSTQRCPIGADDLLPMAVYVTVKARIPLLGAILHYLQDFACESPENGTSNDFTITNYEVIYQYIVDEGKRLLQQHS